MTDDRELLKAAAKAAGKHAQQWAEPGELIEKGGWVQFIGHGHASVWNPLTDDGDALRLAVKLRLDILSFVGGAEVCFCPGTMDDPFGQTLAAEYGDDLNNATRRAVVRAAASLSQEKPHG